MADPKRLLKIRTIRATTRAYEAWMGERIPIVVRDLRTKHRLLSESPFAFLRGTYYRWAEAFPVVCPKLAARTRVPAVGDPHIENFGTWRDAEGRLAWGVNDLDEAHPLAWTADLVRLATSVRFAIADGDLRIDPKPACAAIRDGYATALGQGGRPFVLAEEHLWLGDLAANRLKKPGEFFRHLRASTRPATPPKELSRLLRSALPAGAEQISFAARTAGVGSLGRPRWFAVGLSMGGFVAREAKSSLPSAHVFLTGETPAVDTQSQILAHAVRSRDPMLQYGHGWTIRRLPPSNARVEVAELSSARDRVRLLQAMGSEVANIHLADRKAAAVALRELGATRKSFLEESSAAMEQAVRHDFGVYGRRR